MMNLANTMMGHSMCMNLPVGSRMETGFVWKCVDKMCTSINFGGVLCRKNTILTRLRLSDSGHDFILEVKLGNCQLQE